MTDDELRALVRDAIARHLGGPSGQAAAPGMPQHARPDPAWRDHPSFGKFLALRNDETSACMIEPAVQCNHCGFCQSFGH
jgi:hypothetical protein